MWLCVMNVGVKFQRKNMYDDLLLDIYKEKRHRTEMQSQLVENNCGDHVGFVVVDGKLMWSGDGCFITTVCAEKVCEWYNTGQSNLISTESLKSNVIHSTPKRRESCITVVIDSYGVKENGRQ